MAQIKEMLIFAAGLILTISLIFLGFTVFSKALNIGRFVSEKEDQKLQALKREEIEKYEGQEVQGNKIVSYVRNLYGKAEATISVTRKDSNNIAYSFQIDSSTINELRNEKSSYFINPMKKYRVTLLRDNNDSITRIEIKEI